MLDGKQRSSVLFLETKPSANPGIIMDATMQVADMFLETKLSANPGIIRDVTMHVADVFIVCLAPQIGAACRMAHPNCARFAFSTDCEDS